MIAGRGRNIVIIFSRVLYPRWELDAAPGKLANDLAAGPLRLHLAKEGGAPVRQRGGLLAQVRVDWMVARKTPEQQILYSEYKQQPAGGVGPRVCLPFLPVAPVPGVSRWLIVGGVHAYPPPAYRHGESGIPNAACPCVGAYKNAWG